MKSSPQLSQRHGPKLLRSHHELIGQHPKHNTLRFETNERGGKLRNIQSIKLQTNSYYLINLFFEIRIIQTNLKQDLKEPYMSVLDLQESSHLLYIYHI